MKDYRASWHTDLVISWRYKQSFLMKIDENFSEFEYYLRICINSKLYLLNVILFHENLIVLTMCYYCCCYYVLHILLYCYKYMFYIYVYINKW